MLIIDIKCTTKINYQVKNKACMFLSSSNEQYRRECMVTKCKGTIVDNWNNNLKIIFDTQGFII